MCKVALCNQQTVYRDGYCRRHWKKTDARWRALPMTYRENLTGALADFFEAQMERSQDDVFSTNEEIALLEHVAATFVRVYNDAQARGEIGAITVSGENMAEALLRVAKAKLDAAKVFLSKGTPEDVQTLLQRVAIVAAAELDGLDGGRDIAQRIAAKLRSVSETTAQGPQGNVVAIDELELSVTARRDLLRRLRSRGKGPVNGNSNGDGH